MIIEARPEVEDEVQKEDEGALQVVEDGETVLKGDRVPEQSVRKILDLGGKNSRSPEESEKSGMVQKEKM